MLAFASLIFKMFGINVHKYPTVSSLTFAIFRSNYLDENTKIPITDLKTYEMLQPGYTGGAVDVFQPSNPDNKKVYVYDVNSMYPHVMNKYDEKMFLRSYTP
jgi:hypothetical protein